MGGDKKMTVARMLDGVICEEYDTFMFVYPGYPVNTGVYYSCYQNLSDWDILCIAKMAALEVVEKGYGNLLADFIKREMYIQEEETLSKRLQGSNRDSGGKGFIRFERPWEERG